jgi:UDP-4-amino-4-deoxy-L-arabinose-oxoglutarate aminotransferase
MSESAPLSRLPFSRPCISEAAALDVAEVVRSGWITSGPRVIQFEQDFCAYTGAAHAVAMCSATAGLDVVMHCLDLKHGDEVIVPSINWVSGPNMIELNGGRCVFAEIEADTLNLDLAHVEKLLSPRTRAVMPVHFAGAPIDLDRLRRILATHKTATGNDVMIVEDAAHAAGTRWNGKPIGADSDVAVFSFHPTKNITTAEGGMVVCKSPEMAARLRLGRFHGIRKDAWKNHARSGKDLYHVVEPGRKYNLTDIQATLGIHQLRDLDRMNAERGELAKLYHRLFAGVRCVKPLALPTAPGVTHAWHIFIVLIQHELLTIDRAGVVDRLEQAGIGTALHFPPTHTQDYYARTYPGLRLPISEDVGARLLTIPLFPGMREADVVRVVEAFKTIEKECGR